MLATDNPSLMFLKISSSNTIKTKSSKRSQKAVLKVSTENDKVSQCLICTYMMFSFLGPNFVLFTIFVQKVFKINVNFSIERLREFLSKLLR